MFAYARPETLERAHDLLRESPDARVLCGGTDLLVGLRKGTIRAPLVVDLKRIPELASGITGDETRLRIGATTDLTTLIEDERVRSAFPALVDAARVVGSIQIRNRATLAGNIVNASPAADTVPPMLVAGAVVELIGPDGARRVALADLLLGPGRTSLAPGELVAAVELPIPHGRVGSSFARMTRRRGVDLATVNLACTIEGDGSVRYAFGAVGPRAFLAVDESGALASPEIDAQDRDRILERLTAAATPISNVRASSDYRRAMLLVLARRALAEAHRRRQGTGRAG